jgi:hypothetical protein
MCVWLIMCIFAQVTTIIDLHQRLRNMIVGHCACVPVVSKLQMARALVATPYALCNMLPAFYKRALLRAQHLGPGQDQGTKASLACANCCRRDCLEVALPVVHLQPK